MTVRTAAAAADRDESPEMECLSPLPPSTEDRRPCPYFFSLSTNFGFFLNVKELRWDPPAVASAHSPAIILRDRGHRGHGGRRKKT